MLLALRTRTHNSFLSLRVGSVLLESEVQCVSLACGPSSADLTGPRCHQQPGQMRETSLRWPLGTDRGAGVCTSRVVKVKANCITVDLQEGFACKGALCCKPPHWVFLKFFSVGFQSHMCVILPTA